MGYGHGAVTFEVNDGMLVQLLLNEAWRHSLLEHSSELNCKEDNDYNR